MKKRVLVLGILLVLSLISGVYAACVDSDGGINEGVYGFVSGGGGDDYDFCGKYPWSVPAFPVDREDLSKVNYCSKEKCYILETYCKNDSYAEKIISCPIGCANGICLNSGQTCQESDEGIDYYTLGEVSHGGYKTSDDCFDPLTLDEYFCNSTFIDSQRVECSNKCVFGACVEEGVTCVDSDEGINGDIKGSIGAWSNSGSPYYSEIHDYCEIAGHTTRYGDVISSCSGQEDCFVVENYCTTDGKPGIKYVDCPNGCVNSSCIGGSGEVRDTKERKCSENWECASWSNCLNGQKTRTCTDKNNCGTLSNKPETSMSCDAEGNNPDQETMQEQNPGNQTQQTQQQICQAVALLNCPSGSELQEEKDGFGCIIRYRCSYVLSTGGDVEVQIMPEQANQKLTQEIGEGNYEAELKEEVIDGQKIAIYEITGEKEARLFGLFRIRARIISRVNAQSGEIININKPWWSFLASGI